MFRYLPTAINVVLAIVNYVVFIGWHNIFNLVVGILCTVIAVMCYAMARDMARNYL